MLWSLLPVLVCSTSWDVSATVSQNIWQKNWGLAGQVTRNSPDVFVIMCCLSGPRLFWLSASFLSGHISIWANLWFFLSFVPLKTLQQKAYIILNPTRLFLKLLEKIKKGDGAQNHSFLILRPKSHENLHGKILSRQVSSQQNSMRERYSLKAQRSPLATRPAPSQSTTTAEASAASTKRRCWE